MVNICPLLLGLVFSFIFAADASTRGFGFTGGSGTLPANNVSNVTGDSGSSSSPPSVSNGSASDNTAVTVTVTVTVSGDSGAATSTSSGDSSSETGTGSNSSSGLDDGDSSGSGSSGNATSPGSGSSGNSTSTCGNSTSTSFSGSNLYYAAGLSAEQRKTYLAALQSADMKVLRVWLDGQSGSPKGTPITSFPGLEPDAPGTYNDQVLELYDDFMVDAHSYGIKLQISIHSFNSLQAKNDAYGKKWSISTFYTDNSAATAFDNRIKHVMSHQHKTLGKPWSELSDYIFAFEAQNEAMIGDGQSFITQHAGWQCDRATAMRAALQNDSILVTTGGESWLDESMQSAYLQCADIDIVAIHMYGAGDFDATKLQNYVTKAKQSNKKLMVQEWGVCYSSDSGGCSGQGADPNRNSNIKTRASVLTDAGLPWLYWQAIPNEDPHGGSDYEIGTTNDNSWDTLKQVAQQATAAKGSFDYSSYLL